eukprot:CAMPEP_0170496660 /NCGR_PEP_ID=MMETSP0208-20121228/22288_1 /TAXON_ID=197538 /ORGANISM="Strombidium inclinatum, Strain S3" /LENGTH=150 /DNA_ID=CAMNT_0010773263 /DNA_START=1462 /DNA_END=1914 /DNA_ORIENTATION=-
MVGKLVLDGLLKEFLKFFLLGLNFALGLLLLGLGLLLLLLGQLEPLPLSVAVVHMLAEGVLLVLELRSRYPRLVRQVRHGQSSRIFGGGRLLRRHVAVSALVEVVDHQLSGVEGLLGVLVGLQHEILKLSPKRSIEALAGRQGLLREGDG